MKWFLPMRGTSVALEKSMLGNRHVVTSRSKHNETTTTMDGQSMKTCSVLAGTAKVT